MKIDTGNISRTGAILAGCCSIAAYCAQVGQTLALLIMSLTFLSLSAIWICQAISWRKGMTSKKFLILDLLMTTPILIILVFIGLQNKPDLSNFNKRPIESENGGTINLQLPKEMHPETIEKILNRASKIVEELHKQDIPVSFHIDIRYPISSSKITLLSPTGTVIRNQKPKFSWTPVEGAAEYILIIKDAINQTVWEQRLSRTETSYPEELPPLTGGGIFFWRVHVANNSDIFSEEASFDVMTSLKQEEVENAISTLSKKELSIERTVAEAAILCSYELYEEARLMLEGYILKNNDDSEASNLLTLVYMEIGWLWKLK